MQKVVKVSIGASLWTVLIVSLAAASYNSPAAGAGVSHSGSRARPFIAPIPKKSARIRWRPVLRESVQFLFFENGYRLLQKQTRDNLKGPFFRDWGDSVKGIHGWNDGDPIITNYIAHPMQGAVSGDFLIQNDPQGEAVQFGNNKHYWVSRLKAMAWSAVYSTAFEIGPISEASIGNVGLVRGTDGWVDYFVTPFGGFAMMILEDFLHRYVLSKLEARNTNPWKIGLYRILFNPSRSFAHLMDGKIPFPFKPGASAQALVRNPKPSIYDIISPSEEWRNSQWPLAMPNRGRDQRPLWRWPQESSPSDPMLRPAPPRADMRSPVDG